MLNSLYIKNLAIIDDVTVIFKNGLNVITGETGAGKSLIIKYKIVRGSLDRTGELIVSASTNGVSYDDTYTESGSDVGVTLSAVLDDKDSTTGSETVALKYTTTNSVAATLEYQTTIMV